MYINGRSTFMFWSRAKPHLKPETCELCHFQQSKFLVVYERTTSSLGDRITVVRKVNEPVAGNS